MAEQYLQFYDNNFIVSHINTIIFDLGGVLIDWNPEYLYKQIFTNEKDMRFFLDNICTKEWNENQDAGYPIKQATSNLIKKHPKYINEINAYYTRWEEMFGDYDAHSARILQQLHMQKKHRLLALTNWSAETFYPAKDLYAFLNYFEGIVVSGDEKIKKPDYKIYQILLNRYNVNAKESVFIDDALENIEAANDLDFHTIHFLSASQMETELKNIKVL
jgi:2-haloacid dehalogenase